MEANLSAHISPTYMLAPPQADASLADYMKDRDYPYNLERPLFGKKLTQYSSVQRQSLVIKKVMRQILLGLRRLVPPTTAMTVLESKDFE